MNCIIIDDDKFSIKVLAEFIEKTVFLNLVASFDNAIDGVNYLNGKSGKGIDIVFLDIEMPEMSGMELLDASKMLPQVIICSSKDEYALASYEYNVTDYILKPITYPRFLKAVNKAKENKNAYKDEVTNQDSEIFIKNNSTLVRVKYKDILWIEAMENYVVVNTFEDKFTIHFTMKSIVGKMPSDIFVRVHRSFIVNIRRIDMIEDNSVVMESEDGVKLIPIGKSYKDKLMNDINLIAR